MIETGFYVFNTEAHPIDGAALDCCMKLNEQNTDPLPSLMELIDLKMVFERYLDLINSDFEIRDAKDEVSYPADYGKSNASSIDKDSFLCNLNEKFKSDFYMTSTSRVVFT